MLELDEWDELHTNGFTVLTQHIRNHCGITDNYNNAGLSEPLGSHPLRNPSTGKGGSGVKTVIGVTRPRLTHLTRTLLEEGSTVAEVSNTPHDADVPDSHDIDDILHTVSPGDSLAAIALRYGVSLAAIRHANQLWPSDPIYIRTQLVIPRHRAHCTKQESVSQDTSLSTSGETDPAWISPLMSTASLSSTILTARDTVLSVLPERISIDSLSSRNSTNEEDLELENLPCQQSRPSETNSPSPLSVELDTLSLSHRRYMPAHDITSLLDHDIPPISCQQLRNLTSDSILRPPTSDRDQKSERTVSAPVFVGVRISQLEPEPAMELSPPVRHR